MDSWLKITAGSVSFWLVLFLIVLALDCALAPTANAQNRKILVVSPSNILREISNKIKQQPSLASKELVEFANRLIQEKGFDYHFDVCEVVKQPDRIPSMSSATRSLAMAQTNGRRLALRFIVGSQQDSMCGECWSDIPSVQVTRKEMLVIAEGKRHHLRRPAAFMLDEAELVDETMKKVLRKWQLPYQTIPLGISPDGTKLYLNLYGEDGLDRLILELSENGKIEFKARESVQLGKADPLEDHPTDPRNAYLSFTRFSFGSESYIVRFSAPCT